KTFHSGVEIVDFQADRVFWDESQEQFWQDFVKWVATDDCKNDLIVLDAMQKLLTYESNRPFLNWYGEQPPAKLLKAGRDLLESLSFPELPDDSAAPVRVKAYLDEITSGIRPKAPTP